MLDCYDSSKFHTLYLPQTVTTGTVYGDSVNITDYDCNLAIVVNVGSVTTPGSCAVIIQQSSDDITYTNITDISFTAATTKRKLQVKPLSTAIISKYIRAKIVTTGEYIVSVEFIGKKQYA